MYFKQYLKVLYESLRKT